MALVGFFLLLFGVVLNVSLIRGGHARGMSAADIVRRWPWLLSAALVIVGLVVVLVSQH